jgi:hypothetical protein
MLASSSFVTKCQKKGSIMIHVIKVNAVKEPQRARISVRFITRQAVIVTRPPWTTKVNKQEGREEEGRGENLSPAMRRGIDSRNRVWN